MGRNEGLTDLVTSVCTKMVPRIGSHDTVRPNCGACCTGNYGRGEGRYKYIDAFKTSSECRNNKSCNVKKRPLH